MNNFKFIKKIQQTILVFFIFFLSVNFKNAENEIPSVYVITIDEDIINPIVNKFISKSIQKAYENRASCLIIELDTPGGLLNSTRTIVKNILNAPLPVVVYVSPAGGRAASAGMFITCSAHIAVMAPSTQIGAAHPVSLGMPVLPGKAPLTTEPAQKNKAEKKEKTDEENQNEITDEDNKANEKEESKQKIHSLAPKDIMAEKIMQDTLSWVKSIAKSRNRNEIWMTKAVSDSISSTETEALNAGVIDFIAVDLTDLLSILDGKEVIISSETIVLKTKNASIHHLKMSPSQNFLNAISNPNIAYILMILGIIGLVFEFSHPGIGFPGIGGVICLLLAFFSFNTLPVNYAGMILLILSMILFTAEAFTVTFGILTLGGLISFIIGSMMLFDSSYPFLKISLSIIFTMGITMSAISTFLIYKILKIYKQPGKTGKEGLLQCEATVHTDLNPEGKVFCHGEIWNAVTLNQEFVKKGEEVEIVEVKGLKLIVKRKNHI